MSLLIDLAGQLAPYFSFFASRAADGVLQGTVDRISDRALDAGEGTFRRLIGRDDPASADEGALASRDADRLDAMLAGLNDEERDRLATALTTWLADPEKDPGLVNVVRATAPAPHISVESRGDYNTVVGSVGTFNQHLRDDRS
ncbi:MULTISPECIES: hypothetical protein [unclassified Streptomyces]|uniref:hypothetical protein n=1 Tax=unclassified Streptomyces TaxID=2593676 RepID=UPI0011B94982|nr:MULTISPECIES: hypothetical protein [unclassified Streptomyces]